MKKMMILAAVIAVTVLTAKGYSAYGKMDGADTKAATATSCTNAFTAGSLLACPGGGTNMLSALVAECGKSCTNKFSVNLVECGKSCTNKLAFVLAECGKSCTNKVSGSQI